jgi:oxalate---CoA ligase
MDPRAHETVFDLLHHQAAHRVNATALEAASAGALTYGELLNKVTEFTQALDVRGVTRGSRVAIVLPNGIELAVSMLAVSSIATSVPLNPVYRRDEYTAYFDEIRVTHLLTLKDFPSEARTLAAERNLPVIEVTAGVGFGILTDGQPLTAVPGVSLHAERARAEDIALILLTSGSTGRSKKVPLTHRNILVSVSDICRTLELTPADRCLCMWEQFHIGGLVDLLLVPLASGGTVICAGGFNAALFYELLASKKPTWFQGVPTTLHDLSTYARKNGADPRAAPLRFIRSVASSLSPQLMQEIEDLFGVPVVQTFGMTEAGPLITTNSLPPGKRRPGSVGVSCGPDIRIVSPEDDDLPRGSIGEIVIRGDNVIAGYEDAPDANAKSFRDGWFHTGDTGYIDNDGFVFLTGRLKEMINRGGEKITPQEIDDVLLTHPDVAQAASFSIRHRTLGEEVAAAVVLRNPGTVSETDIRAFVLRRLAEFKVPKMVIFLDRMPRDPIGKINRMSLAVLAETQLNANRVPRPEEGPERSNPRNLPEIGLAAAIVASDKMRSLLAIWREVLDRPDLSLDDDFFLAGGDSLAAVTLFTEMERALGPMPPLSILLEFPTARRLATRLDEIKPSTGLPVIIPIQASGNRPPLFYCHAATSNVIFVRSLLSLVDEEQPLYAIRGRGLEAGETPHNSIEAMAADYIREIKLVRPEGPYVLGGSCAGGYTAYEVARQLRNAGDDVAGVVLVDPDVHPNVAPWFHWENPNTVPVLLWRIYLRFWWAARRRYIIWRRSRGKTRKRSGRAAFETGENRMRQAAIWTGFQNALTEYRPQPYDGDVYMFCSARSRKYLANPRRGWQTLARRVEFFEVGEEHEDLFYAALPNLAAALDKVLGQLALRKTAAKNAAE